MAELVCSKHGPYDAALGSCPYCSETGSRPARPTPLDDEAPTEVGGVGGGGGGGYSAAGTGSDTESTEIPYRREQMGYKDSYDEEETQVGASKERGEDATEIDIVPFTGPVGLLWVKEGGRRGQIYRIKGGTTVGQREGEILLADPKVSGQHAKFTIEDDQFLLWDYGSTNGTFVNGKRIREATPLMENDMIRMGDTVFVLKLLEMKEGRKPARAAKNGSPSKSKKAAK